MLKHVFRNKIKSSNIFGGGVRRMFSKDKETVHNIKLNKVEPVRLSYNSYEVTRSGRDEVSPVLIMHGLLGSKINWEYASKTIHAKSLPQRKVISIDARNHGDSPPTIDNTYTLMAEDVKNLLESLLIRTVAALGQCTGGRAMMMLALKHPELVSSLIVVDMSPVTESRMFRRFQKYMSVMRAVHIKPGITSIDLAREEAERQMKSAIPEKNIRQFLVKNLVKADTQYKWLPNIRALTFSFESEVKPFPRELLKGLQYRGPTLFIGGTKSDFIRSTDEEEIKTWFPNAEFVYVKGAGHWVHMDKPNEFFNLVIGFLNHYKT